MRARNGEGVRGSEAPQKMRELESDRRERGEPSRGWKKGGIEVLWRDRPVC